MNRAILVPLARPYVRIDGQEYACRWGEWLVVDVPPGRHVVEAFSRYKGTHADGGVGRIEVDLASGEQVEIEAKNGWANHMPFRPRLLSR